MFPKPVMLPKSVPIFPITWEDPELLTSPDEVKNENSAVVPKFGWAITPVETINSKSTMNW
jgi:hypothetical protein